MLNTNSEFFDWKVCKLFNVLWNFSPSRPRTETSSTSSVVDCNWSWRITEKKNNSLLIWDDSEILWYLLNPVWGILVSTPKTFLLESSKPGDIEIRTNPKPNDITESQLRSQRKAKTWAPKIELLTAGGQLGISNRKSISSSCSRFFHKFSSTLWGGWLSASRTNELSPIKSKQIKCELPHKWSSPTENKIQVC